MFEKYKAKRLKDKLVFDTFYLEKQYQKIAKEKLLPLKKRIEKMGKLFYAYFDVAFEDYLKNGNINLF